MLDKLLLVLFVPFTVVSLWATWEVGFTGIFAVAVAGPGEAQVFFDLVMALTLSGGLLARDARRRGKPFWPWALGTLALGSFAPLAYYALSRRERHAGAAPKAA